MFHLIDRERLASMAPGSVTGQFEIVAEFRRINEQDAALLRDAVGKGDFAEINVLAHRIKGACMMLGAEQFAESCSFVSMAGRAADLDAVNRALAILEREMAQLNRYLAAMCDEGLLGLSPLPAAPPPPAQSLLCSNLRFLVVEDHAFQRNLIMKFLLRLGAREARGLGDGSGALAALNAQPVDIMVLDLAMPGVDGMELIRTLSVAHHPVSLILNSALSPSLMASLIQVARNCRVNLLGAVSKPLAESTLAPLIAKFRASQMTLQSTGNPT